MLNFELDYSIKDLRERTKVVEDLLGADDGKLQKFFEENPDSKRSQKTIERLSNYICGGKLEKEGSPKPSEEDPDRLTGDAEVDELLLEYMESKRNIQEVRNRPENKKRKYSFNIYIKYLNYAMREIRKAYLCPIRSKGSETSVANTNWLECSYKDYKQVMSLVEMPRLHDGGDLSILVMDIDNIFKKIRTTKLEREVYEIYKTNENIRQVDIAEIMGCGKSNINNTVRSITKKIVAHQKNIEHGGEEN